MKKTYQIELKEFCGDDIIIRAQDVRTLYKIAFSEARAAGRNLSKPAFVFIHELRPDVLDGIWQRWTGYMIGNIDGVITLSYGDRIIWLKEREDGEEM